MGASAPVQALAPAPEPEAPGLGAPTAYLRYLL